jgi:hypothetical protein
MSFLETLFGEWIDGKPCHRRPPPPGPGSPLQPKIDPATGNMILGSNDYPRLDVPPPGNTIFDYPKLYAYRLVETAAALVPGYGNRSLYFRLMMNPPTDTTERAWGAQGSAETKQGCPANFACGVPGHPDLMGVEGSAVHGGNRLVGLMSGIMGYTITRAGRVTEAISSYALQAAVSAGAQVDRAYAFKALRRITLGTILKSYGVVIPDGIGNSGFGYEEPLAAVAVKDGVSAGRNEDPGTGVVHAEAGFKTAVGGVVQAGTSGTFTSVTVVNGIVTAGT